MTGQYIHQQQQQQQQQVHQMDHSSSSGTSLPPDLSSFQYHPTTNLNTVTLTLAKQKHSGFNQTNKVRASSSTDGANASNKKSRKVVPEEHITWEREYVADHLARGHMDHCFAWLDNGGCPQYMVSGFCCYPHSYPTNWTDEMKRKHDLIKTYMDDLYRGCDILELVGRGKKSTALITSKGIASVLAEAIDNKLNALEAAPLSITEISNLTCPPLPAMHYIDQHINWEKGDE
jgi:hypothetical protein